MPLTRSDLDRSSCNTPGCNCSEGPFYLHSQCHPDHPTWSSYENGVLTVECAVCEKIVAEITVA